MDALCSDAPDRFFTGSGSEQAVGKRRWCEAGCPVKTECLLSAMAAESETPAARSRRSIAGDYRWFLRGGLTAPEREELARRHPTTNWRQRWEQRQAERRSA